MDTRLNGDGYAVSGTLQISREGITRIVAPFIRCRKSSGAPPTNYDSGQAGLIFAQFTVLIRLAGFGSVLKNANNILVDLSKVCK
jgi:hypothetical protein